MTILKKALMAAAGAVASYYAAKLVTEFLEEKPLKTRVREGKAKVVDLKTRAATKAESAAAAAKAKYEELAEKASSLIEDRDGDGKPD